MKLTRCPTCHAHIDLQSLIEDDASKELLSFILNTEKPFARAIVSYIALFRSPNRDLSNTRAIKLITEVLALSSNLKRLEIALHNTIQSIQSKPNNTQLKSHGYLKKVLADVPDFTPEPNTAAPAIIQPNDDKKKISKTMNAMQELQDLTK